MRKKLQIFISSTFKDLIEERQSAVSAILDAGHIPAGMELFKAGDEQLEAIYRWIDESDVYVLILGGRYGSIEPKTGKSYTQLEYEYAIEKGIPLFSMVIHEDFLMEKVRLAHEVEDVKEVINHAKYVDFKKLVQSRLCEFFKDHKDIQLAIHKTLASFTSRYQFTGWISGKDLPDVQNYQDKIVQLMEENQKLKEKLSLKTNGKASSKTSSKSNQSNELINGHTMSEIVTILEKTIITIPNYCLGENVDEDADTTLLDIFVSNQPVFTSGLTDSQTSSPISKFYLANVIPKLMVFGLVDKITSKGAYDKYQISRNGLKFLSCWELSKLATS